MCRGRTAHGSRGGEGGNWTGKIDPGSRGAGTNGCQESAFGLEFGTDGIAFGASTCVHRLFSECFLSRYLSNYY